MVRQIVWRAACAVALALAIPSAALAQTISAGTYVLEGGSYSIEVEQQGDTLIVDEPTGKHSEYKKQSDGSFHVYNPNTDTVYGIRRIDNQTVAAFKPFVAGNVPTLLKRVGGAPAVAEIELAPSAAAQKPDDTPGVATGTATVARLAESDDAAKLAQHYLELTRTDPDNVQSWTACAAAALKRSLASAPEADVYAAETAKRLKPLLVDPNVSPCKEVLPDSLFVDEERARLAAEQQARLDALNARANARIEAEKIAAAKREEELRAYEAGVAAAKAAQEQFGRDRAAYDAEVAKASAAKADYDRQMEEYRRKTGGD